MRLNDVVTDIGWNRHSAWVVPSPFCAMGHISDSQYLPGDEMSRKTSKLRHRERIVEFTALPSKSTGDYGKPQALQVVALKKRPVCGLR